MSSELKKFKSNEKDLRIVPMNVEAEQALLAALLTNNSAYEHISDFLKPEHFYDDVNSRIFEAIAKLLENNQLADPLTLKNYFLQKDEMELIGGDRYLIELAKNSTISSNTSEYGKLIYDLFQRREILKISDEISNEANSFDLETNASNIIEKAEVKLYNLSSTGESNQDFKKFSTSLVEAINSAESAYKREGQLSGIPTGFTDLDQLLGGLHKTDLIILAGRPSMGKTALATNIAFKMVNANSMDEEKKKNVVGFFSLEMSSEQLATRILAEDSTISSEKIRRGQLNSNDFQKIVKSSQNLGELTLYIDDSPNLSISALRTRARRLKRKYGLDAIMIDYLQLIRPSLSRPDNRVLEIAEMTRNLKALAKELNIPVLCLSQLSRQVEQRDDKRPQLSDLRESGAIEQDADVVMFIYREEYYTERKEPSPGTEDYQKWQDKMAKIHNVAEVIVAKQRHGPIGKVNLHFEGSTTKFSNLSKNKSLDNIE
ncbi:MAG: Replicative DNA helicase [Alphaproteobacteria bacterium MarineAlpha6_Bin6]|nr:MAG: Replicative DNA helicase [Alphaproteobacteria bacterium MarineAlpha6_Bin6]PPR32745.1 MAG: Replicative DNA helicase [Alphaproteobacteria bacterium MarineAlpha6_Bin5]|tara:strand:+ start:1506 stop:2966 length:1461 start_codon:yes stop_codon:yes gene_type:complete